MYVLIVQCAYSVCPDVMATGVDAVTFVPSVILVYHPSNTCPAHEGEGSAPYVEPYVTVADVGDTSPPFASNVTVYVFAVHFA